MSVTRSYNLQEYGSLKKSQHKSAMYKVKLHTYTQGGPKTDQF